MTTKELIRAEIERLKSKYSSFIDSIFAIAKSLWKEEAHKPLCLLSFLDTLEEPVSDCHDLEEAAEKFARFYDNGTCDGIAQDCFIAGAEWQKKQDEENYAWVKQLPNPNIEKLDGIEITTSDSSAGGKELLYVSNKSYNIGFRDGVAEQKRKMMEGAVEGEVCGRVYGHLNIRFADGVYKYLEPKNISHIPADVSKYNIGDNVRIIIVKEDAE